MDPLVLSAIEKLQWGAVRSDSMSVDLAPAECDALLAYLDELLGITQ